MHKKKINLQHQVSELKKEVSLQVAKV